MTSGISTPNKETIHLTVPAIGTKIAHKKNVTAVIPVTGKKTFLSIPQDYKMR
jgi:hypothetical protein